MEQQQQAGVARKRVRVSTTPQITRAEPHIVERSRRWRQLQFNQRCEKSVSSGKNESGCELNSIPSCKSGTMSFVGWRGYELNMIPSCMNGITSFAEWRKDFSNELYS
ncbi:unnamed protein product [Lasius platythorax]|uniref:Uncharacterized protein n=1 Tax=Lasius platythorax TaxID=488582 RepID=A0AAV2MZ25_9HYME